MIIFQEISQSVLNTNYFAMLYSIKIIKIYIHTHTTGILNGPMVLAMSIVDVDVVSPITACTVEGLKQLSSASFCPLIRANDAPTERGILGQEP